MADNTTTVEEIQTATANKLKAATDAAVKAAVSGGFSDPEFEAELQAAMDKDAGKIPATEKETPAAPAEKKETQAAKPEAKVAEPVKLDIESDIPGELLGDKKTPATESKPTDEAAAEAERQKMIEEQTKGMTPKAAERFKRIEARAHEAEQKAKKFEMDLAAEKEAYQKKIAEASTAKVDTTEAERLKKQIEEYEAIITKSALQEDPRFKAKYDNTIAKEISTIAKLIPAEHVDEFTQLVQLPESKKRNERIDEIVDGIPDIQRTKVLYGIAVADRLTAERAEQIVNWKENKVHLEAEEIRRREVDQRAIEEIQQVAWTKGMESVMSPEGGLEVFRKADGNDEWNAKVESRAAAVKGLLTNITKMQPEKLVEMAARSVAVDDYRKMFLAQRVLVQKLNAQITELSKAAPSAAESSGGEGAEEDNDGFIAAVTKRSVKSGALK